MRWPWTPEHIYHDTVRGLCGACGASWGTSSDGATWGGDVNDEFITGVLRKHAVDCPAKPKPPEPEPEVLPGMIEMARQYQKAQKGELTACLFCGGFHLRTQGSCPRVKRLVGSLPDAITEVEYWPEYDHTGIVYPEELAAIEIPAEGEAEV